MEKATISQLKNHLSAYLRKVRAGHTVVIFDRDRPVARLEQVRDDSDLDERLVRLERAGLVRRPTTRLPLQILKSGAPKSRRSVTQALLEERREGR